MEFLGLLGDAGWIAAIAGLIGSVITYFVTRSNNKKDISISDINDRMQLSKDQYKLISELRTMLIDQRNDIERLRREIVELQKTNLELTLENKHLQQKMTELNQRLEGFRHQQYEQSEGE